jgi:hypothetical protein
MAYDGAIRYMDIATNMLQWSETIRFDGEGGALIAGLREFQNCSIEGDGTKCKIIDSMGDRRGWLQFDLEDKTEIESLNCVVVGKNVLPGTNLLEDHYILVVRSVVLKEEYERAGVGLIQGDCISERKSDIRIV